jgi:Transposase DDE domain
MSHSNKIIKFFEENFNEKKCHDLCRKYKFIERSSSKLKGYEFIITMILPSEGLTRDSLKGLCKRMRQFNPHADLSPQALCERINDKSSSNLMKGIMIELLAKVHQHITNSCPKLATELGKFNRILLEDSTMAILNEHLESEYPGVTRGNNKVKAQVKIDLIYDLFKGSVLDASLFEGNKPDQGLAARIMSFIEPNDLVIRDLGYFDLSILKAIIKIKAYFLTRLKAGVHFYLNIEDNSPLDLGDFLKNNYKNKNVIRLNGYLGKEKIPCQLVIYRQTDEVTAKRLREANKNARKKGEKISKNRKILLSFSIFATNVPENMLSNEMIGTVYRLRWEIELVFKRWKSQLEIHYLKGICKERIDCLIWSRLCMVLIIELIIGNFKMFVDREYKVELSEVKVIQYLMRSNKFSEAIHCYKLEAFLNEMEQDLPRMLLKDKRKRKTLRDRICQKESYYGIKNVA